MSSLAEGIGWKAGDFFMPVRVAVTGAKVSPPLFETMEIVGKPRCLKRIEAARRMEP